MSGYAVQVLQSEIVPVAVLRGQVAPGDLSRVVPMWCGQVWQAVRAQQARAGRHVAIYYDDSIRLEAGVELEGPLIERDGVVRSTTPTGAVATVTHLGPYRQLGRAHAAIHAWSRTTGCLLAGPRWEVYGHWQPEWEADASLIRTDVFYLLADPGASR
jgi:effector-binding domain-containing protein